jgi:hypothetical protein
MRVELNERSHRSNAVPEGIRHGKKLALEKENLGLRVIQNKRKFRRRETNVQRQQHGAGFEHSVIGFQKPMAVAAQEGDAVPWLDAQAEQKPTEPASPISKLLVCESNIVADNGSVVGELFFRVAQAAQWRKRDIHRVSCSVARWQSERAL